MAVLGTALAKELLGFDDANKAFRPWWDTTQDFLMYGMVVLGTPLLMIFFIDINLKKNQDSIYYFYSNNLNTNF